MKTTLMCVVVVALASAVAAAAAASSPVRIVAEDGLAASPSSEWVSLGAADGSRPLQLVFAVTHADGATQDLEDILLRVSDPSNAEHYGKHLTLEEANAVLRAQPHAAETVKTWLAEAGVSVKETGHSDWVVAETTVAVAQELLNAPYHVYKHADTGVEVTRLAAGAAYSLPVAVAFAVDFVAPTVRFTRIRGRTLPPAVLQQYRSELAEELAHHHNLGNGSFFNVPGFLRELYQLPEAFGKASNNLQCVCSFIGQYYSDDDLQEFFGLFFNSSKGQTPKQYGHNDPSNVGMEASLDVQYLMSVGADIPTEVWYTAGENTPFLNWVLNVSAASSLPHIFSFSYGDYENGVSAAYANRINAELAKLGARGTSLLVASGDSGVGGNCSADGRFSPDFPASSPWVTAVGGLVGGDAGKTPTGEWADLISGGGFSDYFPRPSYQDAAVAAFFAKNKSLPNPKWYNRNGAGYPDIAAQSESFVIVFDRIPLPGVGGTSCATPTSSGVFSQLNDLRLQAGKAPLGFLNPLIYQTAPNHVNSFNDAVSGANSGCNDFTGFSAVPGWDPVTGWGSPNFRILSQIVAELP